MSALKIFVTGSPLRGIAFSSLILIRELRINKPAGRRAMMSSSDVIFSSSD
jgi:hypothetical protein